MPKKSLAVAFLAVLLMLLAAPLALAQTGDMPVTRPDPDDPYLIMLNNDQAIYCGSGVVGDPITEACIERGVTTPVMYNQDGTLVGFLRYSSSDNNTDLCITPQEFARQYGTPPPPVDGDPCAHGRVQ